MDLLITLSRGKSSAQLHTRGSGACHPHYTRKHPAASSRLRRPSSRLAAFPTPASYAISSCSPLSTNTTPEDDGNFVISESLWLAAALHTSNFPEAIGPYNSIARCVAHWCTWCCVEKQAVVRRAASVRASGMKRPHQQHECEQCGVKGV